MTERLGWTDCHTFVSYLYDSKAWVDWLPYICLLFSGFSNVYHFTCVWPTALKLGCITNSDMLFLVMGFNSLVDKIKFMLISSRHFYTRRNMFLMNLSRREDLHSVLYEVNYQHGIPNSFLAHLRSYIKHPISHNIKQRLSSVQCFKSVTRKVILKRNLFLQSPSWWSGMCRVSPPPCVSFPREEPSRWGE